MSRVPWVGAFGIPEIIFCFSLKIFLLIILYFVRAAFKGLCAPPTHWGARPHIENRCSNKIFSNYWRNKWFDQWLIISSFSYYKKWNHLHSYTKAKPKRLKTYHITCDYNHLIPNQNIYLYSSISSNLISNLIYNL